MTILASGAELTASYEYSGFSDYWGGHGEADNEEHKEFLLYAFYGRNTSLADIVDELVSDAWNGSASYALSELSEELSDDDIREAIMSDMLNERCRADVASGAVAECSEAWGADAECSCGASLSDVADGDECPGCGEYDDHGESPIFVVVLDYRYPPADADATGCPEYDGETGCDNCSTYDDCGDREDRAGYEHDPLGVDYGDDNDSIKLEGMERLESLTY
jgi:hypothetical protein